MGHVGRTERGGDVETSPDVERVVFRIQRKYLALQLAQEGARPRLQRRVAGSPRIPMGIADEHVGIVMWLEIRHLLEPALTGEAANAYDPTSPGWPPGQASLCDFWAFLAIADRRQRDSHLAEPVGRTVGDLEGAGCDACHTMRDFAMTAGRVRREKAAL